jgi:hypothetical protein
MSQGSGTDGITGVQDHSEGAVLSTTGDAEAGIRAPRSMRTAVLWSLLVLVAFFGADSLLFRTGWYFHYISPDSSTGQLESRLYWLQQAQTTESGDGSEPREVMVIGDSRIAEGFSVPIATQATGSQLHFWNFGIPGTSPRVWYYAIRTADPSRSRFSAIVMALDQYADEDSAENKANREIDLNFVIARLGLLDCFGFSRSFSKPEFQQSALLGCLFRGITLRTDIKAFLHGVIQRVHQHKYFFEHGLEFTTEYGGRPEDLDGLTVDFATQTIHYPSSAKDWQRDSVDGVLFPQRVPQTGATTRYRNQWLGRILDLYANSATRMIFIQLPRAPVHLPKSETPASFLSAAVKRPNVSAMPAESFEDLETPGLFADGLHLNGTGRPEFSKRVAKFVKEKVGDR